MALTPYPLIYGIPAESAIKTGSKAECLPLCTNPKPHRNTGRSNRYPYLIGSPAPGGSSIYPPRSRRKLNLSAPLPAEAQFIRPAPGGSSIIHSHRLVAKG
jgi:hypothetical protein